MREPLVESQVERQNILNNTVALEIFRKNEDRLKGHLWNNEYWFTRQELADFLQVDIRTITNYTNNNLDELSKNGYLVLSGKKLENFKTTFGKENNFLTKTTKLGIFSFRAVLNLSMLIRDNDIARDIRNRILDIIIDLLNEKANGNTKFINQRDPNYLERAYTEKNYRKSFTSALNHYVDMNQYKYAYFTDKIYEYIFKENSKEYREVLQLNKKESTRDTMYSEVLLIIAGLENGFAHELKKAFEKNNNVKLSKERADKLLKAMAEHPMYTPGIEDARLKMASRDNCFRSAYHNKLENYISAVNPRDFEIFLGETSRSLEQQIDDHRDVFERLKDK